MLFPGNWRPSITRTRIFDKNKNNNILKWLIKQMRSTFKMEETFVKITTGGCCTWKSWGLLAKLWRFLVLDRSFWPGSPGDVTAPGTPASVTSPSSPPADQCTSTKKKKCIMQHVIGQTYAVWQTCNSHIQSWSLSQNDLHRFLYSTYNHKVSEKFISLQFIFTLHFYTPSSMSSVKHSIARSNRKALSHTLS